ncbi:DEAD/DEAH box helicase [Roseospirillum parvum]|uniref:DEAD/DEAH box helicase n=1 Tax=Roseospirillum parvum TaxID=83401 RepID=UPI000B848376|nr:DEAD/DEAH box helicase [Roseospirillum parvum]
MTSFESLGLAEPLLRALAAEGFSTPTPIQAQAIGPLLEGRDLVGIAQTGTGKTAAFALPLLHHLDSRPANPKSAKALILAPTRELAAQIADTFRTLGRHKRPSIALVVGGARPGPQVRALARGVDILVATPGRLIDHMNSGVVNLSGTGRLVLDEADQMFDLGFLPAIRKIIGRLPTQRQTILLSATMPGQIRALADEVLSDPVEASVAPAARPVERIAQSVIHVERAAKRAALVDLLRDGVERAIVFTRTKRGADRVSEHLERAGLNAAAIHGDKSQGQRERALGAFRNGRVGILVATDIAARGIDVDGVSHVINFELPNVPEAYVHRIGRTARAGRDGIAVSLCDAEERGLLRDIERLIGKPIEATGDVPPEPARAPRKGPRGNGKFQGKPQGKPGGKFQGKPQGNKPQGKNPQGKPGGAQGSRRRPANTTNDQARAA